MTVNKAILVGRLGADPETHTSQSGMVIANLRIATDDRVKKGETWESETEWHRVVCFGRTAENVARFCKKGKQLYIEGKIKTRKWQDKEGQDRWSTEIVADTIRFLGGGEGEGGGNRGSSYGGGSSGGRSSSTSYGNGTGATNYGSGGGADDDSIPF